MSRFAPFSFVTSFAILALFSVGCGSSDVAQNSGDAATERGNVAQTTSTNPATASPGDVVSQFLDRVRRGGSDSGAGQLLTQKAQQELARIGQEIQPLGTPDARFDVTRSVAIPGEENAAWVHSIWSEPGNAGEVTSTQVVWKLSREADGWRISGMALEIDPNTAPLEIDFENGTQLANTLFGADQENADSTQPAAAENAAPTIATEPSQGMQFPNF
ncbi:hypothetical protein [Stieleria varia]|uniref:DUF3828 domain-containing protein n=1 Tax=Stieleria varia TaxID=2528005 RepID=A0A5C6B7B6_9BACT|nr:hypothetical protein [Stieleria varia]TWU08145.1 hypothetical protein Pla52n_07270 [Stieleria varia]